MDRIVALKTHSAPLAGNLDGAGASRAVRAERARPRPHAIHPAHQQTPLRVRRSDHTIRAVVSAFVDAPIA
jgi:hypothetical protein